MVVLVFRQQWGVVVYFVQFFFARFFRGRVFRVYYGGERVRGGSQWLFSCWEFRWSVVFSFICFLLQRFVSFSVVFFYGGCEYSGVVVQMCEYLVFVIIGDDGQVLEFFTGLVETAVIIYFFFVRFYFFYGSRG